MVEHKPSPEEPKVALIGSSDVEERVMFRGSALGLDSPWHHIFAGTGVMGPAVHFLDELLHIPEKKKGCLLMSFPDLQSVAQ